MMIVSWQALKAMVARALVCLVLIISTLSSFADEPDQLSELLEAKLWTERDAYDTSHVLMVPMHAAYFRKDEVRISEFRQFARRWLIDTSRSDLGRLTERQFDYFLARLTYLEASDAACGQLSADLFGVLSERAENNINSPAWNWRMDPFPSQIELLLWKMRQESTDPSFLRAIFDEDLFSIATSADLVTIANHCSWIVPEYVYDMARQGSAAVISGGAFSSAGWLFQPGVWTDHPDYQYAGNQTLGSELSARPITGIGWDSSYSHRFPLFLVSLVCFTHNTQLSNAALRVKDAYTDQWVRTPVAYCTT